ncbi:MAG: sodium:solute symporter family protein [Bacteroidota bacterium]|nr:sodium:solute symporter family protein [Bacteroidota bacterium]
MVHFSTLDILLILLYFSAVLFIGFRTARRKKDSTDEYLLAGRTLTLPMFVATLVSTWYGGILGVGEYSYRYGISNWVVFGVPYYFFALVFALTLAKKARATNLFSIPDKLYAAYDTKTSLLGAALTFVLISPAPYVLMLGILVQLMFGLNLTLSVILSSAAALVYLYSGGFRSDVYTNALEFILMFLGFAVIVPFSYLKFGGFDFLQHHLPPLHLTWNGGNSLQFVIVWFFIAMWTLIDPAFHQRCYAAKDGTTAKRGILFSIPFWFVFDFMTSTAGLYARASLPNLSQPVFAYPMLAEITLPSVAKGLFYIGMLATIMSSLSSLTFIGGGTIGNDIIGRILLQEKTEIRAAAITVWTKIGLIITALLAIVLALEIPSVVKLWYVIGTSVIPGLLVPLIASYFPRFHIPAPFAFAAMALGWLTSTVWLIAGQCNGGAYPLSLEPMYPGLLLSLVCWGMGKFKVQSSKLKVQ